MLGRIPLAPRMLASMCIVAPGLTVTGASGASAQVNLGFTAGPTIADFSGSYVDSSISTWGFVGGAYAEWRFARQWSVSGGVNVISQKGAFEVESPTQDSMYDYRTGYFEIPLALNFLVPFAQDAWDFRAFAGVTPALGSSCDVKPSSQFSFDTDCADGEPGGDFEKGDLLFQFGVGIDRVFEGGSGFGFDVRYSIGTQTVLEEASTAGMSAKNRVLDIKIRLFLPLEGPRQQ